MIDLPQKAWGMAIKPSLALGVLLGTALPVGIG
jgi:hypothetical protein